MKYQALFSSKDKSRKLKCRVLQFLSKNRLSVCIQIPVILAFVCVYRRWIKWVQAGYINCRLLQFLFGTLRVNLVRLVRMFQW